MELVATDLVPVAVNAQKLWGNKTASELRAINAALKIQTRLGNGQVQQLRVVPGWDSHSRVEYREWGEKIISLPCS
ncbi:hypothetical protein HMPREF0044_1069 [Gleimia coleocanis DSM 15436]|uniref:Uncharacterized protein n=1 Tax=Gleimia coleocanis DSM 15436 TaxID=525245 RepID=C0W0J1_9ACTO|nr:hypothetical protein HMPREF0044_1069 [Gleimia coleocanis DSM 15436]